MLDTLYERFLSCLPVHCICVVVIEVGDPFLQLVAALAVLDAEVEQVNVGIQ